MPPTNAVIAQIFGVQYMSMLGGFVFFSHQVGSFLGVWLGGKLYDSTGSYNVVMDFEGDKIKAERMYMDTGFARTVAQFFGPDFGEIPGVSRLTDKFPPPVPRLDRAAAHAADSNH